MEFLPKKNRDRTRLLFLAIGLFIMLDLSVLAVTYWLSYQIAENAVTINLAGRQRMLTQRMVKALLHLEQAKGHVQRTEALAELRLTFDLFDSTLQSLRLGGIATGGDGHPVKIAAITTSPAANLLSEADRTWTPYRQKVVTLLRSQDNLTQQNVSAAVIQASESNLKLLDLMNTLTFELESSAVSKTSRIRLLQIVTFTLAVMSFLQLILMMRRELHKTSKHKDTLNSIIHKINAGILVCEKDGRIRAANQSAGTLFGYEATEMIGLMQQDLLILQDDVLVGKRQDGSQFHAESQNRAFILDNAMVYLKTVADVSQQRSMEITLSHLAYHDALTGLPNRLLFDDRLQQSILSAKRRSGQLAVLFVDLNKFKQVNDTHGHHIGDLLLKEIAQRLRQSLREEDTVSRFGGDEFGILLASVSGRQDCELVVDSLLKAIGMPFTAEGITLAPGASIGVSLYPADGEDEKILVRRADQAMYQAKRDITCAYAYYTMADI